MTKEFNEHITENALLAFILYIVVVTAWLSGFNPMAIFLETVIYSLIFTGILYVVILRVNLLGYFIKKKTSKNILEKPILISAILTSGLAILSILLSDYIGRLLKGLSLAAVPNVPVMLAEFFALFCLTLGITWIRQQI